MRTDLRPFHRPRTAWAAAGAIARPAACAALLLLAGCGGLPSFGNTDPTRLEGTDPNGIDPDDRPQSAEARLIERTHPIDPLRVPAEPPLVIDPAAIPGGKQLTRLHPEVRRMAIALYTEAAANGIELRFMSGYRAFKPRSAKARAGKASWHEFGMAFDLILAHRSDMRSALAHYDADAEQWATVGAIGERLGLIWGLKWGRHEVFHFEWHPGMKSAIRGPDLGVLLSEAGEDGKAFEKTWWRFRAPPAAPPPPAPVPAPTDPAPTDPAPTDPAPRGGGIEAAPSGM